MKLINIKTSADFAVLFDNGRYSTHARKLEALLGHRHWKILEVAKVALPPRKFAPFRKWFRFGDDLFHMADTVDRVSLISSILEITRSGFPFIERYNYFMLF